MNFSFDDLYRIGELAFLVGSGWAYIRARLNRIEMRLDRVARAQKKMRRVLFTLKRPAAERPRA